MFGYVKVRFKQEGERSTCALLVVVEKEDASVFVCVSISKPQSTPSDSPLSLVPAIISLIA